uniref:Cas12f1-like TNB domain-containing protein n=1 Tax=Fervidobacterium nodosum TaxID=2424 RepID=A0A7C5U337_9BACT
MEKLKCKARIYGITIIQLNESYTSQRCLKYMSIDKTSRVHSELYICRE